MDHKPQSRRREPRAATQQQQQQQQQRCVSRSSTGGHSGREETECATTKIEKEKKLSEILFLFNHARVLSFSASLLPLSFFSSVRQWPPPALSPLPLLKKRKARAREKPPSPQSHQ